MTDRPPFMQRLAARLAAEGPAYDRELALVLDELAAENDDFAKYLDKPLRDEYDVVVIGSGPGGGTLTYALSATGKSVLLVERGDLLPQEPDNWNSTAVLEQQKYANSEEWLDATGTPYQPAMFYYVGGMTKLYAGTLLRMRTTDFEERQHHDGISPAWPVTYD